MKKFMLALLLSHLVITAFSQNSGSPDTAVITVPAFADASTKRFYQSYADHVMKCVHAIRDKNEAQAKALFKDPGEQMVTREKALAKELVKNAEEKKKYIQFATEVYPYLKEIQQSDYYEKMYGK